MKTILKIFIISLLLVNCSDSRKNQIIEFDYKYPTTETLIECDVDNILLYQEALQSFEADIMKFYTPDTPELSKAYRQFIRKALSRKEEYAEIASEHSKQIIAVLKTDESLWTTNPDRSKVNFNHPLFTCIGKHIKDKNSRETYNALIATNSMSIRMFREMLKRKPTALKEDHYMAMYTAFELFYGKLYNEDFSGDTKSTENASKINKIGSTNNGHNH